MNFLNRGISYITNFRSQTNFQLGSVKTVSGFRALKSLSLKIWKLVPPEIKNSRTLEN